MRRFHLKYGSVLVSECLVCFLVQSLVHSGKSGPRKGDACFSESFQRRDDHSQRKVNCTLQ